MARPFSVVMEAVAITAAKSLIVIAAPATAMICITRVWIEQQAVEVSEMLEYRLNRLSTAGAGTGTAYTPVAKEVQDQGANDGTYTVNFTAEPTTYDTNPVWRDSANVLNGLIYVPDLEQRIWVPPSAKIGLRLINAPGASLTVTAGIDVLEVG